MGGSLTTGGCRILVSGGVGKKVPWSKPTTLFGNFLNQCTFTSGSVVEPHEFGIGHPGH